MSFTGSNRSNSTGRRQFLKSLLGVGSVLEASPVSAQRQTGGAFYWADLRTGQIGFPTGTSVKSGLPGSLMKVVAAAVLRERHILPANQTYECNGRIVLHKRTYTCQVAHGPMSLTEALAFSCNVFFAQAADLLTPQLFLDCAARFGLKEQVAGFPSGPAPLKPEHDAQSYVLGLAPDLQPQGLQLLRMAALVATHGLVPHLHSAEQPDPEGKPFKLELDDSAWSVLSQGMQLASREGTAKGLDPSNRLRVAAKTGTAPHGKTFQSWIVGYFPYDSPRYAFCARAYEGTSQDAAVPLAQKYLLSREWP